MASSSHSNFRGKNPQEMPPPSQNGHPAVLQTSHFSTLGNQKPWLHSDAEIASSGEPVLMELSKSSDPEAVRTHDKEKDVITNDASNLQVNCTTCQIPESYSDELSVSDVVHGNVDIVANRMKAMKERPLAQLKARARMLLEEADGGMGNNLHKFIQVRPDLTHTMLLTAHHVQLEILVAIKTGVPGFLHENLKIPRSRLVEIFFYQRCRNIDCQNPLPARECQCVCCSRRGFCNRCMCLICDRYDFNFNTCRWIGCIGCSHWTHAECAVREGKIRTALTAKNGSPHVETLFSCKACQGTSELLGFVKNAVQKCAKIWDRDTFLRELECVHKIFSVSVDFKGKKLVMKCAELIERLKTVPAEPMSPDVLLQALQEIEQDDAPLKITTNEEPVQQNIYLQNACNNQHSVQDAVHQPMEIATDHEISVATDDEVDLQVIEESRKQYISDQKRRRREKAKMSAAARRLRKKTAAEAEKQQERENAPKNAAEQLAIMAAQQQQLQLREQKEKEEAEAERLKEAEKLMAAERLQKEKEKAEAEEREKAMALAAAEKEREKAMALAAEKERLQKEKAEAEEREKAMAWAAAENERVEQKEKAEAEKREKALAWYAEIKLRKENTNKEDERIIEERLRRKQEADEMLRAVRLKKTEAEMFRAKADEAEKEAEKLQLMAMAKVDLTAEKDYADWYLNHRMEEAEAEKRYLLHRLRSQEENNEQQLALSLAPPVAAASGSGGGGWVAAAPATSTKSVLLSRIMEMVKGMRPSEAANVRGMLQEALAMPSSGDAGAAASEGGEDSLQMRMLREIHNVVISMIGMSKAP